MGLFDGFKNIFSKTGKRQTAATTAPVQTRPATQQPTKSAPVTPLVTNQSAAAAAPEKTVAQQRPQVAGRSVILKPLQTEKTQTTGQYAFEVSANATKNTVRQAFQAKYGKIPAGIRMLNIIGKIKNRGRIVGKQRDWKKAVVVLPKNETVELWQ